MMVYKLKKSCSASCDIILNHEVGDIECINQVKHILYSYLSN